MTKQSTCSECKKPFPSGEPIWIWVMKGSEVCQDCARAIDAAMNAKPIKAERLA